MKGPELLYRGSLKSCNYQCSYCPFSKHRMSGRELKKDQKQWEAFVCAVEERAETLQIGALMIAPYGEALIHPWYWEGLGRISRLEGTGAVGAQTNLSFPAAESLELFQKAGGNLKKLYLWATFHPEMTTVETFAETCRELTGKGIRLCAGAVGVPQNAAFLGKLRKSLPKEIYLWINRMDGLGRLYTREETEAFLEIDPYFGRELADLPADPGQCQNRLFVEGNGRVRTCNISRNQVPGPADLQEMQQKGKLPDPVCGQKRCSCYLAYGGRRDFMNRILFGPYPVFRIPRRAKAVFLDIMGTLMIRDRNASGRERISPWVRVNLEGLHRDGILLFFATTLPYREAKRRCGGIWHLFSGGVFAGGAHLVLQEGDGTWELIQAMEEAVLPVLKEFGKEQSCRILSYRFKERLYKVTMRRPKPEQWQEAERKETEERLQKAGIGKVRIFSEENCLQIVSEQATKAEGVRLLCRKLQIRPEETAAAGDSAEDEGMLRLCGKELESSCRYPEN